MLCCCIFLCKCMCVCMCTYCIFFILTEKLEKRGEVSQANKNCLNKSSEEYYSIEMKCWKRSMLNMKRMKSKKKNKNKWKHKNEKKYYKQSCVYTMVYAHAFELLASKVENT